MSLVREPIMPEVGYGSLLDLRQPAFCFPNICLLIPQGSTTGLEGVSRGVSETFDGD